MANEMNNPVSRHRVVLEERCRLSVSGVTDVIAFDEESITADTDMGMMVIRGEDLHISRLNLDEGVLQVEGSVDSVDYGGDQGAKGGLLLGKIFR